MRRARSYSIIDHQLLHGGYFHRLSHQALALYLFLVVVSDREGKSFYGPKTIMEILRLNPDQWELILDELINTRLIDYRSPYFWVLSLEEVHGRYQSQDSIPKGRAKSISSPDRRKTSDQSLQSIATVLRNLARETP